MALAESLQRQGIRPMFGVSKTTLETVGGLAQVSFEAIELGDAETPSNELAPGARVVIFDSYAWDWTVERTWRDRGMLRVVIDDLANRRHDCELLVDHTPGREARHYEGLVSDDCQILAGPSFALLRSDFRRLREQALLRRSEADPTRLLISMGLTDVRGITRRVVEGVMQADPGLTMDVVVGRDAKSLAWLRKETSGPQVRVHVDLDAAGMAKLMASADIAIGGAGGTSLERCCMGLPSLVIVLAENQRLIAESLEHAGAARIVGDLARATPDRISSAVRSFAAQRPALRECSRVAASIVDGNGADRVCEAILTHLR
jgi:UDP-2,4-diacetamido-2,4,6-trideoxy-beta-L-altropyranose hydrolase